MPQVYDTILLAVGGILALVGATALTAGPTLAIAPAALGAGIVALALFVLPPDSRAVVGSSVDQQDPNTVRGTKSRKTALSED